MKSFRLARKQLFINLANCLFGSALVLLATGSIADDDGKLTLGDLPIGIVCWLANGLIWYFQIFRQVIEITIREDGIVEFRSWSGCKSVRASDIEAIDSEFFSYGIIRVHHTQGTIRLKYNIDGLHEFIWTMKSLNPRLRTFDC